jgi:hypothetical protein
VRAVFYVGIRDVKSSHIIGNLCPLEKMGVLTTTLNINTPPVGVTTMKQTALLVCRYCALGFLLVSVLFNHPAIISSRASTTSKATTLAIPDVTELTIPAAPSTHQTPIKTINLIGERHCGTKWITSHLQQCFASQDIKVLNRYTRWKHWFQYQDAIQYPPNSAVVVAMFRDPYDWIDSMRKKPYHSPNHFDLGWKEFVTRPWGMERGKNDKQLIDEKQTQNTSCMHRFEFNEVIPCSRGDRNMYGDYHGKPVGITYELNNDGSGEIYNSILELRRDKIHNFLNVQRYEGVAALIPVQFEYMVTRGTAELIEEIERVTGVRAHSSCKPTLARERSAKVLDTEFVDWMDEHVDWETESLIGYSRRESVPK